MSLNSPRLGKLSLFIFLEVILFASGSLSFASPPREIIPENRQRLAFEPDEDMGSPGSVQGGGTRASIPSSWEPNKYKPPENIGNPGRTQSGGTRSGSSESSPEQTLTALVPTSSQGFGTTTQGYPSFYIYLPPLPKDSGSEESGEVTVWSVNFALLDKQGSLIYETTLKIPEGDQVISLSLPPYAGLEPLELDKDYQWFFDITPAIKDDDPLLVAGNANYSVSGIIRRVAISSQLERVLEEAPSLEKARILAEAEIWYDAIALLGQLKRSNLDNQAIATDWNRLLQAAGLGHISQESLTRNTP